MSVGKDMLSFSNAGIPIQTQATFSQPILSLLSYRRAQQLFPPTELMSDEHFNRNIWPDQKFLRIFATSSDDDPQVCSMV